jgi:hypothetical protein
MMGIKNAQKLANEFHRRSFDPLLKWYAFVQAGEIENATLSVHYSHLQSAFQNALSYMSSATGVSVHDIQERLPVKEIESAARLTVGPQEHLLGISRQHSNSIVGIATHVAGAIADAVVSDKLGINIEVGAGAFAALNNVFCNWRMGDELASLHSALNDYNIALNGACRAIHCDPQLAELAAQVERKRLAIGFLCFCVFTAVALLVWRFYLPGTDSSLEVPKTPETPKIRTLPPPGEWFDDAGNAYQAIQLPGALQIRRRDSKATSDQLTIRLFLADSSSTFHVELRHLATPLKGLSFGAKVPESCFFTESDLDGIGRTATFEGGILTVPTRTFEPTRKSFVAAGAVVTGCVGLANLPARDAVLRLKRR